MPLPSTSASEEIEDAVLFAPAIAQPLTPPLAVESPIQPTLIQPEKPELSILQGFAGVFGTTFITVFLAELGDKTQLTTLLMSAQSHSPWTVFVGASCALVLTSLLGVLVGQWLASRVSPQTLQKASGICLLLISVGLLWDAFGH